jgi:predicted DNA-binding protein with PD1-like motif
VQLIDDKSVSRGMIRVEPGEDFVESLQTLATAAGWSEAFVTGAGMLDLVELAPVGGGSILTLENAELLSLCGRLVVRDGKVVANLRAALMAHGRVHNGLIHAAMTGEVLLVVDAVSARATAPSRVSPTVASVPASPTPSPSAVAVSSDGRSASKPLSQNFSTKPLLAKMPPRGDEHENPEVEPGDMLDHPQLGVCEVVGDDGSGGTRIRMSSGRVRVLRLDALRVMPSDKSEDADDEDGRRLFKIVGPRQRR